MRQVAKYDAIEGRKEVLHAEGQEPVLTASVI